MDSPDNPDWCVALQKVSKRYPGNSVALEEVDFRVRAGEVTGLIGANGSGKTTLLRAVAGELKIDSGSIQTLGATPFPPGKTLRRRLGSLSQQPALDPEMTTRETLRFFCALHGIHGSHAQLRIEEVSGQFAIETILAKRISQLSGGFRQRLHLAAGLIHEPDLILADEPTSALDPETRRLVWNLLAGKAAAGATVIVASHDLVEVERGCDRITMLAEGRKVADGTPADVIASHGATALEAEFEHPVDPDQLQAIDGVDIARVQGNRLTALIGEIPPESILEKLGPVRTYRCEKPSLATAYLKLSGESIGLPPPASAGRNRKGRKK